MKSPLGYLPCALAAVGLVAFGFVLKTETDGYRRAVETWAERDLAARTQLAAESIQDALVTGDFAHLRDFADARRADGLRLTVLTSPGGMVYDSEPTASASPSSPAPAAWSTTPSRRPPATTATAPR